MTTKVDLAVAGMKCGGCENTIKEALTGKDGIISVDPRHADNKVTVEFDNAVLEEDGVIELIENSGFTVED